MYLILPCASKLTQYLCIRAGNIFLIRWYIFMKMYSEKSFWNVIIHSQQCVVSRGVLYTHAMWCTSTNIDPIHAPPSWNHSTVWMTGETPGVVGGAQVWLGMIHWENKCVPYIYQFSKKKWSICTNLSWSLGQILNSIDDLFLSEMFADFSLFGAGGRGEKKSLPNIALYIRLSYILAHWLVKSVSCDQK